MIRDFFRGVRDYAEFLVGALLLAAAVTAIVMCARNQ